jgi:hypothetical protein
LERKEEKNNLPSPITTMSAHVTAQATSTAQEQITFTQSQMMVK